MTFLGWINGLFGGRPPKRNPAQKGITRATDKREAVAYGKAQAEYEKRRAEKRAQGEPKHQPMRKRGKS